MILDGTITKTYTPAQFEEDFPAVFRLVLILPERDRFTALILTGAFVLAPDGTKR